MLTTIDANHQKGTYFLDIERFGRRRCANEVYKMEGMGVGYCTESSSSIQIPCSRIIWSDVVAFEWYDFKMKLEGVISATGQTVRIEGRFNDGK